MCRSKLREGGRSVTVTRCNTFNFLESSGSFSRLEATRWASVGKEASEAPAVAKDSAKDSGPVTLAKGSRSVAKGLAKGSRSDQVQAWSGLPVRDCHLNLGTAPDGLTRVRTLLCQPARHWGRQSHPHMCSTTVSTTTDARGC